MQTFDFFQAEDLLNVSRETFDRFVIYHDLLVRWQKIKNLVSPSSLGQIWTRHFADSTQIIRLAPDALKWADLGSGAGFPGLAVGICLADKPGAKVHLIESDHRKCAFLRQVAQETGAPVIIHNARIESVANQLNDIQIVTARALASLPQLLQLSQPILKTGATGLFLKGQDVASELTSAAIFSMVKLEFLPSSTNPDARIVRVVWAGSED